LNKAELDKAELDKGKEEQPMAGINFDERDTKMGARIEIDP